jgi:hypothetical protein
MRKERGARVRFSLMAKHYRLAGFANFGHVCAGFQKRRSCSRAASFCKMPEDV